MGPFMGHPSPTEHWNLEPDFQSPGLRHCSLHSHPLLMFQCLVREILFPGLRAPPAAYPIPAAQSRTHGLVLLTHWGAPCQQFCSASFPLGCCAAPNPRALPTSVQCWCPVQ